MSKFKVGDIVEHRLYSEEFGEGEVVSLHTDVFYVKWAKDDCALGYPEDTHLVLIKAQPTHQQVTYGLFQKLSSGVWALQHTSSFQKDLVDAKEYYAYSARLKILPLFAELPQD